MGIPGSGAHWSTHIGNLSVRPRCYDRYDLANRVNGVRESLTCCAWSAVPVQLCEYFVPELHIQQPLTASDRSRYGSEQSRQHASILHRGTSNNNGNLQSSTASHGGPNYPQFLTFNDSYIYDGLNRLLASYDNDVNNNPLWARILSYDRYGNMSLVVNTGVPLYGTTPVTQNGYNPFNSATNRLVSGRFDAAGNQTEVGSYSLAYDAENRQTQAVDNVSEGQVAYGYDGAGQRVTKSNNGLISTLYVYDIFGQLAAEYNSFPKQQSPCTTCYLSYDHLGSVRMVTDSAANIIARHDYLPFGEEIPANTADRRSEWGPFGDRVNQKFTGQERDDETGFDFFPARYFYGAQGRFNSPDPGNAGTDPTNPQSWNGYSYVWNNPLTFVDPSGLFLSANPGSGGDEGEITAAIMAGIGLGSGPGREGVAGSACGSRL